MKGKIFDDIKGIPVALVSLILITLWYLFSLLYFGENGLACAPNHKYSFLHPFGKADNSCLYYPKNEKLPPGTIRLPCASLGVCAFDPLLKLGALFYILFDVSAVLLGFKFVSRFLRKSNGELSAALNGFVKVISKIVLILFTLFGIVWALGFGLF